MSRPIRSRHETPPIDDDPVKASRFGTAAADDPRARPSHVTKPSRHTQADERTGEAPAPHHASTTAMGVTNDYISPYAREQSTTFSIAPPGSRTGIVVGKQSASSLSALGRGFVEYVPFRDIQAALRYVTLNPKVLDESDFVRRYCMEACNALIGDNLARAKSVIEKLVMVKHCNALSQRATSRYFHALQDREEPVLSRFDEDFDKFWRNCGNAADSASRESRTGPALRRDDAIDINAASYQLAQLNIGSSPAVQASRRHDPREGDDGLDDGHGSRSGPPREADDGPSGGYNLQSGARHGPVEIDPTAPIPRHDAERHVRGLPSEVSEPSFQGTRGEEERLDPRYYKRSPQEAGKLLKVGRVFAILRHSEFTGDDMGQLKWKSRAKQGVVVFSHVCRMVVVKECHGFVWAIPINTYAGHGVAKRGFNREDIDAHAIIYMDDEHPTVLEGEPRMKKTPIKVIPVGKEILEAASRINFSKPHSIDHNVKFLNIGKVAANSMPYLSAYWKQYL